MGMRLDLRLFKSPDGVISCGLTFDEQSNGFAGHIRVGKIDQPICDLVRETVQDLVSTHEHLFLNGLELSAEDSRLHTA